MCKEKSEEDVRTDFINKVQYLIKEWGNIPNKTIEEKLFGLAHDILYTLDGGYACLPKFIVAPDPHYADKDYDIGNDDDWFPENTPVHCDISGNLHDFLK